MHINYKVITGMLKQLFVVPFRLKGGPSDFGMKILQKY